MPSITNSTCKEAVLLPRLPSGVRGRLAYEMISGVIAGVNISYDRAFDTRVLADLKVRFGGGLTIVDQGLSWFEVEPLNFFCGRNSCHGFR